MCLLLLLTFLDLVGFGIIMPMLPVLVYNYKLTTLEIGILVSSFFIAQFFGSIIIGYLSDIWGKKIVLIIALLGLIFGYYINGFIQTISDSFYVLVLLRLIIGFFSGNIAVIFATVYNKSTKRDLVKNMAYLGSAFTLGFIFGPTIGGYLSKDNDSITPFYYTGTFYLVCFILVSLYFKNPIINDNSPKENIFSAIKSIFKNIDILFPLGLFIFYSFVFSGLEVFLLTQTLGLKMGYSPLTIGLVWTYFAVILTIVQIFITKYIPKNIAIVGGWIVFALSSIALSCAYNIYMLLFILLITAFSLGILFPNINAHLSLMGNDRQKGLIFGFNFAAEAVGGSLGPYLLSYIYYVTDIMSIVWVTLGILTFIVSIISFYYLTNRSKSITST